MTSEAADRPAADSDADETKADPEAFVLRGRPARAIRFKRGAVVALAALSSIGLIATAWFALRPGRLHLAGRPEETTAAGKPPTGAFDALPAGYGDVPKLGPPLPGDLGRPILDHQHAMSVDPVAGESTRAGQAAATEQDRRASGLRFARQSGLLVQTSMKSGQAAGTEMTTSPPSAQTPDTSHLKLDPDRDPNAQQRKADFIAAREGGGDADEHRLIPPASPNMLSAGSVIAASLITGLRSDLPGLVTAQVTERVFDSATGTILLIPQGARLIGSYDSVIAFGQRRALIVWQRIILPDGSSLRIDNVPATDPSGYAGLRDKVDLHTWQLLKGIALSTLLGVSSELALSGQGDLVQALRLSTQDTVSRAGDQITQRNLGTQPTITIRPGAPVRLVVHKDLVLTPWAEGKK
jgi:type IV secretory pathway VirB10-like protein